MFDNFFWRWDAWDFYRLTNKSIINGIETTYWAIGPLRFRQQVKV